MRVGWASMGSIISKRTKSFYLIGIFALRLHQVAPRHFIAGGIEFNKKLVEDCRLGSHQDPTSYSFQISPFWTFTCTTKLLGILQILQSSAPGGTKSWKEKMCSMFSALQFFNICYPLVNTKKTIETRAISPGLLYKWWIIQWLRIIYCVRLLEAIYLICVHSRWLKPAVSGHFKCTAGNAWDKTTKIIHQFPGMIWTMYRF